MDVNIGPGRFPNGKRLELPGDFALSSVKCSEEHATAALKIVRDDSTILEIKTDCRLDEFGSYFEQLLSERYEFFDRKTAMLFVRRLRERVGDPSTHADQRRLLDAEFGCDLISRANPMPRMSRASRYGFSEISPTASGP